jgi:imidazolonepropionase-like amidohydrolase
MLRFMWGALALFCTGALAAPVENYSIVSNGETVGYVAVSAKGNTLDVDFKIDDNGRGPKHKERLTLGAGGIPVHWSIDGTSLMGGDVHESMNWQTGRQRWTSQADHGDETAAAAKLYVVNDGSPYALYLYAKALLKTKTHRLDVLPRGTLHLEKIGTPTVGEGKAAVALDAYMLSGINMAPDVILLDRHGNLFAVLGEDMIVRKGYESEGPALNALNERLSLERLKTLQAATAHRYEIPVRIRNVRIFDPKLLAMTGPKAVVVYRGAITTVEATDAPVPAGEAVIDGQGASLVAGLHDMHAHISIWDGPLNVAGGVTTVRDMGNNNQTLPKLMDEIDHGELIGPHIIPSGFIEGRSPYSARDGVVADTLEDGLKAVHWYADHGYIQIKIYNSMNPAWVKPLADEAKKLGLRVVGHVPAFTTADQMIEAGYDEITHVNQLMLGWLLKPGEDTRTPLRLTAMTRAADLDLNSEKVRHTIALMKEHDASWDTTISIVEQLMMSRAGEVPENAAAYIDHMPVGVQRYKRRSYVTFKDEAEKERYALAFDKAMQAIALFHREGIRLWPGTDAANGFTLHRELELYVKAGLSPAEVLRIATYDCDAYLKRDQDYGSIERGKRADFFLVNGDPTKDIGTVRKVRLVVKDGVFYAPQEIYQAYGITPFAAPLPLPAETRNAK